MENKEKQSNENNIPEPDTRVSTKIQDPEELDTETKKNNYRLGEGSGRHMLTIKRGLWPLYL